MYYRQPRYFRNFQCIGSDCLQNCCYGWHIIWHKGEIEKVKKAPNISPELKELVETSFAPAEDPNDFNIKFNPKQAKCPFQTDEMLCKIQRELGAEYLSYTCTSYPRCHIITNDNHTLYRFCYTSCPAVTKTLLNDENSMDLLSASAVRDQGKNFMARNDPQKKKDHPELQYHNELFEFFYDLISDKRMPLETAIILGALAAQKLTEVVSLMDYDRIPDAIKSFRKQFHNAKQLKAIQNIKPNYYLKFGFLSEIIEKRIEDGVTILLHDNTGTLNIDLYNEGEQRLSEMLKGREYFLRNLALNLLFEFAVPFEFEEKTIFENYSLFAVGFGCLKLNLIAACSVEEGINFRTCGLVFNYIGDDKLIGTAATICRGICQSSDKANVLLQLLNDNKFTTPAYLALLVK